MKEELFPELIEAHKELLEHYEDSLYNEEDDLMYHSCPLCQVTGFNTEDYYNSNISQSSKCADCTYQGLLRCVFPKGGKQSNKYFSDSGEAYELPKAVIDAKIRLHKDFLSVYELWLEKAIDAKETAEKLTEVYDKYITKYKDQ